MTGFEAFFLPLPVSGGGSPVPQDRFCLLHTPEDSSAARGAIVFVHAFAEEMNNCRHMAALQARAFADAGWTVLQIDLFGCGDSAGDFGDATWQQWIDDVTAGAEWLRAKTGFQPVLWGMRAGALLCVQAAQAMPGARDLILWQPIISGKQFLQQFLRLKVAHQILAPTEAPRIGTQELRAQLGHGESVEVAGYTLTPALALGMERAELELSDHHARVAWFELSGSDNAELAPAARTRIERWQEKGRTIQASAMHGPAFWQMPGAGDSADLIRSTLAAVDGWRA